MSKRLPTVLIFVAAAGIAGWIHHQAHSARREVTTLRAEVVDLGRRLDAHSTECASTLRRARDAAATHSGTAAELSQAASGQGRTVEVSAHAQPPMADPERPLSDDEISERVADRFEAQSRNVAWASEASGALRRVVSKALPAGSRLHDIDCRDTMCRVSARLDGEPSYRQYTSDIVMSSDWAGPIFFTVEDGTSQGSIESIAYLIRPGVKWSPEEDDQT